MTTPWNTHAIARFLRAGDTGSIGVALRVEHPADVAALMARFPPAEAGRILLALPTDRAADAFGYLPPEAQVALARTLDRKALAAVFSRWRMTSGPTSSPPCPRTSAPPFSPRWHRPSETISCALPPIPRAPWGR